MKRFKTSGPGRCIQSLPYIMYERSEWLASMRVCACPSELTLLANAISPKISCACPYSGLFLNSGFWGRLSTESQPKKLN